jgi:hypothetical protein
MDFIEMAFLLPHTYDENSIIAMNTRYGIKGGLTQNVACSGKRAIHIPNIDALLVRQYVLTCQLHF